MSSTAAALRALLQVQAADQVSRFPQYRGHFDEYKMVQIKRAIKTKMGLAFDQDEFAIAKPEIRHFIRHDNVKGVAITVWSMKHKCDISILARDVEIIEGVFSEIEIDDRGV